MPLWIPITIFAAFMQNVRSALQKRMGDEIGTAGATYARFLFAWPFAILYLLAVHQLDGSGLPDLNQNFMLNSLVGGAAQILATAALVHSFTYRNFTVATTYSKTEAILTAMFSFLILGEGISTQASVAILISFVGVLVLSARGGEDTPLALLKSLGQPAALLGLASGALFGVAAVFYRGAALSLPDDHSLFLRASMTLAFVLLWQTVLMGTWFLAQDRAALLRLLRQWRRALPVGITGVISSIGWFTAVALYHAAYVRALGQIELLFTIAASVLFFREHISRRELTGVAFVASGLIFLVLSP